LTDLQRDQTGRPQLVHRTTRALRANDLLDNDTISVSRGALVAADVLPSVRLP
jgi:hypothetical protein